MRQMYTGMKSKGETHTCILYTFRTCARVAEATLGQITNFPVEHLHMELFTLAVQFTQRILHYKGLSGFPY